MEEPVGPDLGYEVVHGLGVAQIGLQHTHIGWKPDPLLVGVQDAAEDLHMALTDEIGCQMPSGEAAHAGDQGTQVILPLSQMHSITDAFCDYIRLDRQLQPGDIRVGIGA